MSITDKSADTGSRLVVARGWEEGEKQRLLLDIRFFGGAIKIF